MNREPVKQCTMKRERDIITIDEYGRLNLPTDTAAIWMTEAEIAELFGTTAGAVHAAIKAILKENVLHGYEAADTSVWKTETVQTCITRRSSSLLHSVFVRKGQRDCGNIYSVHSVQQTNGLQSIY